MENTNLIVIRKKESEDGKMFIADRDDFDWQNLSECYDQFGQQIGEENAGDYCLESSYCECLRNEFLNDFKKAGFELEEDNCIDDILESEDEKIKKFIEAWKEENEMHTRVFAWNYFDGNNWKSIIINDDTSDLEANYEEVESKEAGEILKAFESVQFGQHERGLCTIESGEYIFTHSLFAGDPFLANVELN